jgi:hypothetical protein
MKAFQFEENVFWKYDPYQMIFDMNITVCLVAYNHHLDAKKEKMVNKESWVEVQQILQDQHLTSTKG